MKRAAFLFGTFLLLMPCWNPTSGRNGTAAPEPVALKAFRLRMEGKPKEALALLDFKKLAAEKDAAGLFELARTAFFLNNFDGAYLAVKKVLRLEGDNPRYLFWHGFITFIRNVSRYHIANKLNRQLNAEAVKSLKKALAIDPLYHPARLQLIFILTRIKPEAGGNKAEALALAEDLAKRAPGWGALAMERVILPGKDPGPALVKAEKVLEKNPDDLGALLAKAESLMRKGEQEEAGRTVEKILKLDPRRRMLYLNAAQVGLRTKKWDLSYGYIDKFLALPGITAPEKARALLTHAQLERRQNGSDAYKKWLAKAEAVDPDILKRYMSPPADLFRPPVTPGKKTLSGESDS